MGDAAIAVGAAGDLLLVKAVADQAGAGAVDIVLGRERAQRALTLGVRAGGHQPGGRMEQVAEPVPVAGHTGVAGNAGVEGGDDGVHRGYVGGVGCGGGRGGRGQGSLG